MTHQPTLTVPLKFINGEETPGSSGQPTLPVDADLDDNRSLFKNIDEVVLKIRYQWDGILSRAQVRTSDWLAHI